LLPLHLNAQRPAVDVLACAMTKPRECEPDGERLPLPSGIRRKLKST